MSCPEQVEYLLGWVYALHARSGVSMAGYAPLTYATIETWARLMDIGDLHPLEVEALIQLDQAMLVDDETTKEDEVTLPSSRPSWPTRKES